MKNNRCIELSRWVYTRLLTLYPKEHHDVYGADMLQVFTDQCRSVAITRNRLGFLTLWLRTLIDLGINAFREHMTSPHLSQGLLEALPNSPLPWKGVVLVLIPGLIFFVSQIVQLTGEDWFFLISLRAAYFLILPVLGVWIWKRKFPIWGLIPLGLLFYNLLSLVAGLGYYWARFLNIYASNVHLKWLVVLVTRFTPDYQRLTLSTVFLLSIGLLLWLAIRRIGITRIAWVWLGVYVLLVVVKVLVYSQNFIAHSYSWDNKNFLYLAYNSGLCQAAGFLVLILLGAQLAHRHGRLAVLLPLGYLLPTIIYGRMDSENPAVLLITVSTIVLVFRFLVALAAPLWIVRSAREQAQKRASAISLVALITLQTGFNLWILFCFAWEYLELAGIYLNISNQLLIGAGLALALALYRAIPETQAVQKEEELIPDRASVS
jgi:hypothetical protein